MNKFTSIGILTLLLSLLVGAHHGGGVQVYPTETYTITYAQVPLSPLIGEEVTAVISIGNNETDTLESEEKTATIELIEAGNTTHTEDITIKGAAQFKHTYNAEGVYTILITIDDETADFATQVREIKQESPINLTTILSVVFGAIGGILGMKLQKKMKK